MRSHFREVSPEAVETYPDLKQDYDNFQAARDTITIEGDTVKVDVDGEIKQFNKKHFPSELTDQRRFAKEHDLVSKSLGERKKGHWSIEEAVISSISDKIAESAEFQEGDKISFPEQRAYWNKVPFSHGTVESITGQGYSIKTPVGVDGGSVTIPFDEAKPYETKEIVTPTIEKAAKNSDKLVLEPGKKVTVLGRTGDFKLLADNGEEAIIEPMNRGASDTRKIEVPPEKIKSNAIVSYDGKKLPRNYDNRKAGIDLERLEQFKENFMKEQTPEEDKDMLVDYTLPKQVKELVLQGKMKEAAAEAKKRLSNGKIHQVKKSLMMGKHRKSKWKQESLKREPTERLKNDLIP